MNIAVCEDNSEDLSKLCHLLTGLIEEADYDAKLTPFQSGEELLSALDTEYAPSICFLDIYMKGVSGVKAARSLKEKHPQCAIVFATSSPDHMADGFDIGAVHYLLKPVSRDAVTQAFNRALRTVGQEARYVELIVNRQRRRVLLSDILYAETQAKCCYIYVKSEAEPWRVYMKLDELEALLSHRRFLRCHHSYIVNLDAVAAPTSEGDFLMENGVTVPVRQRSRKELLAAYNDYHFERLRRGGI